MPRQWCFTLILLWTFLLLCRVDARSDISIDQNENLQACRRACSILSKDFPLQTFLNVSPDMEDAKQRERVPACHIQPNTTQEVAAIYTTVKQERCAFAIKSGGHGRIPNQSNAEHGVTIDLANINHVEVADSQDSANLGSGSRWARVYAELEKHNLTVMGGRVGGVGVGGFYMGGGISFYSGRYGWACDHIQSFEVVLPNATIALINEESDPALFWALHGASNNLGIVTSFKVRAWHPDPLYWHLQPNLAFRLASLTRLNEKFARENTDPDATTLLGFGRVWGLWLCSAQMISTNLKASIPDAFKPWRWSPWILSFADSEFLAPTSMAAISVRSVETNSPGYRTIFRTMTVEISAELEQQMSEVVRELINELRPLTKGSKGTLYQTDPDLFVFEPFIVFQPLPRKTFIQTLSSSENSSSSGLVDNTTFPLHLSPTDPPLDLVLLSWRYSRPPPKYHILFPTQQSWDDFMDTVTRTLWDRLEDLAKKAGKYHPFIYPNYAGTGQNPYTKAALGTETLERWRSVQKRVDPEGIYAEGGLCTGGFKLVREDHDDVEEGDVTGSQYDSNRDQKSGNGERGGRGGSNGRRKDEL